MNILSNKEELLVAGGFCFCGTYEPQEINEFLINDIFEKKGGETPIYFANAGMLGFFTNKKQDCKNYCCNDYYKAGYFALVINSDGQYNDDLLNSLTKESFEAC